MRAPRLWVTIGLVALGAALAGATVRAYFSSQESVEHEIVGLIDESRFSMDIALFELRSPRLMKALAQAKSRGVRVRLLLDASRPTPPAIPLGDMRWLGGKRPHRRGVMHNKFAVFDGRRVLTGSYNWTSGAEYSNYENAVFIDEADVVAAYALEFSRMWERSTLQPTPIPARFRISAPAGRIRIPWLRAKKRTKHSPSRHARIRVLR